jgi:hypothetical protein
MATKTLNLTTAPICTCGSREFETSAGGRTPQGRAEYQLICRQCKAPVSVGKSTYALYQYLSGHKPSASFLKLFDLG